jgi:hypothetical protein
LVGIIMRKKVSVKDGYAGSIKTKTMSLHEFCSSKVVRDVKRNRARNVEQAKTHTTILTKVMIQ